MAAMEATMMPRDRLLAAIHAQQHDEELRLVEQRIRRVLYFMEHPSAAPHLSPGLLREMLAVLEAERTRLTSPEKDRTP
jgi:hypothetical protein